MIAPDNRKSMNGSSVMGRLRRDVRGNTLAMMAIALIPISALVGSGIDTARLYVVKVRLQQACDAGVLAGRKTMTSSASTTLDPTATDQANKSFTNNFKSGWMQTNTVSFTPSKTTDQQVSGVASTNVPMTIMKMFAAPDVTLNVTCEARYDVADTDLMFVLDTTGSMACTTGGSCTGAVDSYTRPDGTTGYHAREASGSKISGLRTAVLNFYDTIAANIDPTTHVRYGFVTYTSTVNAGYALPPSSIVDSWAYQSRSVLSDANNGNSSTSDYTGKTDAQCTALAGRSPTAGFTATGQATQYTVNKLPSANSGTCRITNQPLKPTWRYQPVTFDTSQYKTGATVDDPSKLDGSTSKWQGCVEERDTTATATFDVNNLPPDLDPDLPATSNSTKWRPMWPDVVYYRGNNTPYDYSGNKTLQTSAPTAPYIYGDRDDGSNPVSVGTPAYLSAGYVSCGKPVSRLGPMSRSDVSSYVNASDFVPQGGTYHDTGMIWGTRMISPTGIFASDTAAWPGRNTPNRYIIFMTDGDMAPNYNIYGMYGMELYDKRVTGGSGLGNDEDYHNARFLAECAAAKARNIKVFVIGFGQTLTTQLTQCASPGKAYYASDNTSLNAAFQDIAKQVALLRISQ
jgi:Flp pilus assembly protein TadG